MSLPGSDDSQIVIRMDMSEATGALIAEYMPRLDEELRARVSQQLWLRTMFIEQLRKVRRADRAQFVERCDATLELLDPIEPVSAEDVGAARDGLTMATYCAFLSSAVMSYEPISPKAAAVIRGEMHDVRDAAKRVLGEPEFEHVVKDAQRKLAGVNVRKEPPR